METEVSKHGPPDEVKEALLSLQRFSQSTSQEFSFKTAIDSKVDSFHSFSESTITIDDFEASHEKSPLQDYFKPRSRALAHELASLNRLSVTERGVVERKHSLGTLSSEIISKKELDINAIKLKTKSLTLPGSYSESIVGDSKLGSDLRDVLLYRSWTGDRLPPASVNDLRSILKSVSNSNPNTVATSEHFYSGDKTGTELTPKQINEKSLQIVNELLEQVGNALHNLQYRFV